MNEKKITRLEALSNYNVAHFQQNWMVFGMKNTFCVSVFYFLFAFETPVLCFHSVRCVENVKSVCASCECVFEWAKGRMETIRQTLSCFCTMGCVCNMLHYEFIHTLGSTIIPRYEVPACTWPSFTFPLRVDVLSFTLIMLSRWMLCCEKAASSKRMSETKSIST